MRHYVQRLFFLFLTLSYGGLCGETAIDFSGEAPPLKAESSAEGLFSRADGQWRFASEGIDADKHRWGSLIVPDAPGRQFTAEYTFRIVRLNRWTGFGAILRAADGANVRFTMTNHGKDRKLSVVWMADREKKKEASESCPDVPGALVFQRRADTFALVFRPERGDERRVELGGVDLPENAQFRLSFSAPKGTIMDVRPLRLVFKKDPSPAQGENPPADAAPAKANDASAKVDDASVAVVARPVLLARENAETAGAPGEDGGTLVLRPGGRAVFAAELPLNFDEVKLRLRADGPVRVRLTQLGLAETLAVGEARTLEPSPGAALPVDQAWDLEHVRHRYAHSRKWPMPRASNDTIPFFVLSTAGEAPVTVSDLRIVGKAAPPAPPPAVDRVVAVAIAGQAGGFATVVPDKDATAALAPFPLDYSGARSEGGVPFDARPLFFSDQECVSLPIDRAVGEFNFLHAAGDSRGLPPWIGDYSLVYEDGAAESIHIVNRWNCGPYAPEFQTPLSGDHTWWGPTGFPKADVVYLPKTATGLKWNALYRARYRNPRPDKIVREIRVRLRPGQTLALAALTLRAPEDCVIGLVEPARAVFAAGSTLAADVFEYSAVPRAPQEDRAFGFGKDALKADGGVAAMRRQGRLGAGFARLAVPAGEAWPGPVVIGDGLSGSSTLGLMPAPAPQDKPMYFNMIVTGSENADQCDWIHRLGYDAAVIHTLYWKDDPEVWKERMATFTGAGLSVRIRPHGLAPLRTPQNIAYHRLADGDSGIVADGKLFDPADPEARREVRERQVALAELGKDYPSIISQETSYYSQQGLQRGSDASTLYCGPALWKEFVERLKGLYSPEEFARETGLDDFGLLDLSFVAKQPGGKLLTELTKTSVAANSTLQREISEAVNAVRPRLFQAFHAGYRDPEHVFMGRTLPEYLRIGRDVAPVGIGNAAAERYWSSFEQWMAGARTFGFDHIDEICANPPPYEHARRAFMWMAAFQTRESSYCRFSVGRPSAQNVAELKPFHHLLRNAEYLPDPVALARSFRSGYADAPEAGRQKRHTTQLAAYSLVNTLRSLNINPDRYWLDDFPEKDAVYRGKLLIDDCNHAIPDDFAARIEQFVREGGTYLASADTDALNDGLVFRRFGITRDAGGMGYSGEGLVVDNGIRRVFSKAVGQGRIVIMDSSWKTGDFNFDIGYEKPDYLAFAAELFAECGAFRPLARADTPGVCVIPYRARDGSVLVYAVNLAATGKEARVGLSAGALKAVRRVLDQRTGADAPVTTTGDEYHETAVFLPPLSATVLRYQ